MFKPAAAMTLAAVCFGAPLVTAQEPETSENGIWDQVVALYEQAKDAGETAAEDVY
nr:hypothetical protein [Acidobacteriota bacterium]NIO60185.1 hypothetical protein [Acidobacteriota bacterium]NIQ86396.1 hypothetical protein [Acidobacteriota bacterium]